MNSATTNSNFHDFFLFLGVPEDKLPEVLPSTIEKASALGASIFEEKNPIPIELITRSDIFVITDAMRDLKDSGDPNWELVTALINAMEEAEDPDGTYGNLLFNMHAVIDGNFQTVPKHLNAQQPPKGYDARYRIWQRPGDEIRANIA